MQESTSVIVHGPQGCGKTRNAEQLRTHFGLTEIIELEDFAGVFIPDRGALVLTSADPATIYAPRFHVFAFHEAMALLRKEEAPAILRNAAQAIDDRATLRDCPAGERSMTRCVAAFNALTGHALSETEGWHFMSILKLARATAGGHHLDDHTDHAAYAALAGEAAEREAGTA